VLSVQSAILIRREEKNERTTGHATIEITGLNEQQKARGFQMFDAGKMINIYINGIQLTSTAVIPGNRQLAIENAKYLIGIYEQVYTCAYDAGWMDAKREGK
jgi:hypothetical protein